MGDILIAGSILAVVIAFVFILVLYRKTSKEESVTDVDKKELQYMEKKAKVAEEKKSLVEKPKTLNKS